VNDCLGLLRRNHNTQRSIDVSCTHVLFAVQILICRIQDLSSPVYQNSLIGLNFLHKVQTCQQSMLTILNEISWLIGVWIVYKILIYTWKKNRHETWFVLSASQLELANYTNCKIVHTTSEALNNEEVIFSGQLLAYPSFYFVGMGSKEFNALPQWNCFFLLEN
jgi:hypothetical protein